MNKKNVFVTGGAGYIGSHTCVELLESGFDVTVIDNYSNSSQKSIERVKAITNKPVKVIEGDVRDEGLLNELFKTEKFDAVIHFAGLKSVGESNAQPLRYYDNNVSGSVALLKIMRTHSAKTFLFSSSATVYGNPQYLPLAEDHPLSPINPYGKSKLMVEDVLRDLFASDSNWAIGILRYFNPVGAHRSGLIGEDPRDVPNNLMPYLAQVAVGRREKLSVFGNDFDTPDGTGVRDFIHVVDLARGHVKALQKLLKDPTLLTINLGTGAGCSVMQLRDAFEAASQRPIPYQIGPRRVGDAASSYADCSFANKIIDWKATHTIQDMCEDSWRWQNQNRNGFE